MRPSGPTEMPGPGSQKAETKVQVLLLPFPTTPLPRRTVRKHTFLRTLRGLRENNEALASHPVLTHLKCEVLYSNTLNDQGNTGLCITAIQKGRQSQGRRTEPSQARQALLIPAQHDAQ